MLGTWRFRRFLDQMKQTRLLRRAERAVTQVSLTAGGANHGLPFPLVVSLTSYPLRFPYLARTLRSLLSQATRPDRLVLWIAEADFAEVPAEVTALESHGLEIRTCEDLRSFKKLIPALALWPEAAIVTADDDVYYTPDWLEGLVTAARNRPGCVAAHRIHLARRDEAGRLAPYADWELATAAISAGGPGDLLFPTGVGGIYYPPGALDPRVMDKTLFQALCPRADDVWFFWMARLAGTPHIGTGRDFRVLPWAGSQDSALYLDNLLAGENDGQILAMKQHFGTLPPLPQAQSLPSEGPDRSATSSLVATPG